MLKILRGTIVRDSYLRRMKAEIQRLPSAPTLVIIQVGGRADSNVYINQKKIFAEKIGAKIVHSIYPESVTQDELITLIKKLNRKKDVHGIIVQIPLPKHLNKQLLIEAIDPQKDVDGLTSTNAAYLYNDDPQGLIPATAQGILMLLDHYKISIKGKHVVMVGRSALVGKPTALALLNRDASVTIAHKHTKNLKRITQAADIVVIAIGQPAFITREYVKGGQIVIDVGINSKQGKLVGDVDQPDVGSLVSAISPVPGGVGPMTVTALFKNLLKAYHLQSLK
jgi:methylenetetrahydrofolate dehydrogenase (NADP+)/methenyltetrahydrofolate cyclohydrolase